MHQSLPRRTVAGLLAVFAAATPMGASAQVRGEPAITPLTARSGGPIDPLQADLRFDLVDLAIEIFPAEHRLNGVATLHFTAREALSQVLVDLDRNLPVSAIALDSQPLAKSAWSNPQGKLRIKLPRTIAKGASFALRIAYGGTPHVAVNAPWDDGLVWSTTPSGAPWVATTAEGYGCDLFWPCLDFPTGEPARADLHITVPAGLKAPSNGVLKGVDTLPDGRTRWNWSVKQPNTYAIALNVAPYDELTGSYASRYGNKVPLQLWYLPDHAEGAKRLFAEYAPTLDFFETMIGPYPFGDEKLGVVETPYLGMEHQTINAYGNGYKPDPSGFDTLFQHELAHEWFGNQLTAANWDDYWLHEGYGTYMQPLYGEWRDGEARYATMMAALRTKIMNDAPIVSGRELTEEQVYETENGGPGQDIYNKAAWMLHTLRNTIGDKAFFEVTRRIVYGRPDPKPGNFAPRYGSTQEYEAIVRDVTGKDYGWFFDIYLRQAALPELDQTRTGDTLTLTWKVPGNTPFPLPVEVKVGDTVHRLAMAGGTDSIAVPPGAHVVIDPFDRVLKRDPVIERYRQWQAEQRAQS